MSKLIRKQNTFDRLADIAAINHYKHAFGTFRRVTKSDDEILAHIAEINASGESGEPTFKSPTNHPLGYWKVLNAIADTDGITRRELFAEFKHNLTFQLRRLQYAQLIQLNYKTHKFTVTSFGSDYIFAVKNEFEV